jgi:hypothetical protein
MTELAIQMAGNRTAFRPGEPMAGAVSWTLDTLAERVELRLFWYTRGKGTAATEVVEVVRFEKPQLHEKRQFQVTAPDGPYSFSGKLISLVWALELVVRPGKLCHTQGIVISPNGAEVELGVVADAKGSGE